MALYHVHAHVISKGQCEGGSTGFAQYIARESPDKASQHVRYLHREGWSDEDLVAAGTASLPAWATSGSHFFAMADRYERHNATVARCFEIALPRELSPEQRLDLAADLRATFFDQYPSAWAIHNPIDPQGEEHPHLHLMISERRPLDDYARGPQQYFRRAATAGQDPATHGVRKDRSWHGPARLHELRAGIATLTNAALERAGVATAVSHASLRARGHERDPAVYTRAAAQAPVEARRVDVQRWHHPWEQTQDLVAWRQQKVREGIRDVSREAMVEQVRDRFWQRDTSPARAQERQASVDRRIAREHARTGRPMQGATLPLRHASIPARARREPTMEELTRRWACPLIANKVSGIYHTSRHANYGDVHPKNQERFWTEQEAIDAGYRRALNDDYGPGTGIPMTIEEATRQIRMLEAQQGQTPRRRGWPALGDEDERIAGGTLHVRLYDHDRGLGW